MSYPTTLQCIKRKSGWRQFYLNIPATLAEALDCQEGETWQWRQRQKGPRPRVAG